MYISPTFVEGNRVETKTLCFFAVKICNYSQSTLNFETHCMHAKIWYFFSKKSNLYFVLIFLFSGDVFSDPISNTTNPVELGSTHNLNDKRTRLYGTHEFPKNAAPWTSPKAKKILTQDSLDDDTIEEVVVTATLRPVGKSESPVSIEIYRTAFFKLNPTPNLFEALQLASGVRPQLNCNVCNTGDIHINGMEGGYTLILVDGMPIISNLGSVYGMMGLPNSMIERMEIMKGPSSVLYGSEAMGGIINIITKTPKIPKYYSDKHSFDSPESNIPKNWKRPSARFDLDVHSTSWLETNLDVSSVHFLNSRTSILTGINGFWYDQLKDVNQDGFTDIALQKRISLFQKWNVARPQNRALNLGIRALTEERWGGELNYSPQDWGKETLYGERIGTRRLEFMGNYDLPIAIPIRWMISYNIHHQNSYYGTTHYQAVQNTFFSQWVYQNKPLKWWDLVGGATVRNNYYNDNMPVDSLQAQYEALAKPNNIWIPGLFNQNNLNLNSKWTANIGLRMDYHPIHRFIPGYTLALKFVPQKTTVARLNFGRGYRIVNLFTEEHAALSGSRRMVIPVFLNPETSYNFSASLNQTWTWGQVLFDLETNAFGAIFQNRIYPDYDSDPNEIRFVNTLQNSYNRGININLNVQLPKRVSLRWGVTFMDVQAPFSGDTLSDGNIEIHYQTPYFTEKWNSSLTVSYKSRNQRWNVDFTGNAVSSMRLPVLGIYDPRPDRSPWYALLNLNGGYRWNKKLEFYGGIKNVLDWTPARNVPFLIARSHDPFDKKVVFVNGMAQRTAENPYGLTFDPSYVYTANQGRRIFIGFRWQW